MIRDRVVDTNAGRVRGRHDGRAWSFKGVPYGGDTSGSRRFRRARAPQSWSGVRDCLDYGPSCPQMTVGQFTGAELPEIAEPMMGVWNRERHTSEECLVLNVWTPAPGAGARPVLVWLHGGGLSTGSASWPLYDFTNLCERNDVVVVGVNHRLGILGFLDLSGAGERYADSGNVGMLDIVDALHWIRTNIGAFGGNAENVTVFGESGGGVKVSMLLAMPEARGLFHRAFVMSGTTLFGEEPDDARATTEATLDAVGHRAAAHRLETVPVGRLIDAAIEVRGGPRRVYEPGPRFAPVLGASLPSHPVDALRSGATASVDLVIGCTTHEVLPFLDPDGLWALTDRSAIERLRVMLGEHSAAMYTAYRDLDPDASASARFVQLTSDWSWRVPHIRVAEAAVSGGAAPFMYLFVRGSLGPDNVMRAGHGCDMPFFFDNVDRAPAFDGPGAETCARAASGAVAALARTGEPGHGGLPTWPVYDLERRPTMRLDAVPVVEDDPGGRERELWTDFDDRAIGLRP